MIMVIDVGNTNIVLGIYAEENLIHHWRIYTRRNQTEDEYGLLITGFLREKEILPEHINGLVISCVVPSLNSALLQMGRKYFKLEPLVVGAGIKTGLTIQYAYPQEIGADRIVNAVGALAEYEPPLIIVDSGTANTFCYIDEKGQYCGGAIAPGIHITTEALYKHAAQLPRVELKLPGHVIGKNTAQSMQSGILYGYIGQVDGVLKRMIAQAKQKPTVIATGGLAELMASESEYVDLVDPFLTLKGLYKLYLQNKEGAD